MEGPIRRHAMSPFEAVEPRQDRYPFRGPIDPRQHLVQFYGQEGAFLDSLGEFVGGGLLHGESVVVIATASHLGALDTRLRARSFDVDRAIIQDRYLPLDAAGTLAQFMVNGWPDEQRFRAVVAGIVARARRGAPRVRAFGELVAVMWARGEHAATVHLERLWHGLCHEHGFSLLCAYPTSGFAADADGAIRQIVDSHTEVVA
jgi:hypothetical protein